MGYNSTLPTPKIEGALLASLKTKKIEYNITQDKSSNYASLTEAIAAVDDDEYKVKGIVLTFYTGTDWVSKRYNGEDASGFATETNWVDAGGAVGGTQYLDLSMFSSESGTLSEEDYQKVVKAYEDGVNVLKYVETVNEQQFDVYFYGNVLYTSGSYVISSTTTVTNEGGIKLVGFNIIITESSKEYYNLKEEILVINIGGGNRCLTDNGQYAEFAKPVKNERVFSGSQATKQLSPNKFYKFEEGLGSLTITLAAEESGILNEYMFEFATGSTPTTLSVPDTVKWSGGSAPTIEANKTYQVSIVNNLAVYAAF